MNSEVKQGYSRMTEGNPFRLIMRFSLPLLAGSALQQVYNMADSIIVGNFVGNTALVAVGGAFPIVFLISSLFIGLGIGAMVMVSQFFGANETGNLKKTVDTIYTGLVVGAIPISLLSLLLIQPAIQLMQVPAEAAQEAYTYLFIVLFGLLGSLGYNANAGILQGVGDGKTPLLLLAIACLLDNILNLVFVLGFGMGVTGAALSTVIGQWSSWIFGIYFINRKYPMLRIRVFSFQFEKKIFKEVMRLGIPAGIQNALFSVATLLMTRLVNLQGTDFAAGVNAANKLDTFAFLPIQSLSVAATTFTGQNMGAGKIERVKKGMWSSLSIGLGFSLLGLLVVPAGPFLMRMFTSDPVVIQNGMIYLRSIMPFYSMLAVLFIVNSVIRGAGESLIPMISVLVGICLVRLPVAYWLEWQFGGESIFYSFAIGWAASLVFIIPYYLTGRWKHKKVTKESELLAVDSGEII